MGQVPQYAIIGGGRVAHHFSRYLEQLGLPFKTWTRSGPGSGQLSEILGWATRVLVLISDREIVGFLTENPVARGKAIHFSGALVTELAWSAHPLLSFAEELHERRYYEAIPFVIEAEGPPFAELLPGLANPAFAIPRSEKPRYHALCVMSGNFSTLLWRKLFGDLEDRFGIPRSAALPYLESIMHNISAPEGVRLTGPLTRGDVNTVNANITALSQDPYQGVYEAFVKAWHGNERTS